MASMMIPDAATMRRWDAFSMQQQGISSLELMERAAAQCTGWLINNSAAHKYYILCGPGNNGGDGLAIARQLYSKGKKVEVFVTGYGTRESEDNKTNHRQLAKTAVPLHTLQPGDELPPFPQGSLIIEALFGFGLSRPLSGDYATLIKSVNQQGLPVISIDVPAGMFTDSSSKGNTIIVATHTLTFQRLKLCFLLAENETFMGTVHTLPIGLSDDFGDEHKSRFVMTDRTQVSSFYRKRTKFSHKGTYGHVLLVAGNEGKMGAAVMSAKACLRSGMGLLSCLVPKQQFPILQTAVPEAMVMDRNDNVEASKYDCIGAGPGLGTGDETAELLYKLMTCSGKPMLLDADALNIIARRKEWLAIIPKQSVITPHPKEFDRLFGDCANDMERIEKAISVAQNHQIIVVLKGAYTLITNGEHNYFNSTGNNGMATGGSGDVLSGLITGLLAQHYPPFEAAITGVYIHGLSADLCLGVQSYESLLPTDMTEQFGKAFKLVQNDNGALEKAPLYPS